MKIDELVSLYGASPQMRALRKSLENKSVKTVFLQGLLGSAIPVVFAAYCQEEKKEKNIESGFPLLFILSDADEAGYFYHDLTQLLGQNDVLFFPSSYRRSVKYGQRDAANEILRTEVLARLTATQDSPPYIVSYPEAIAELVVSRNSLNEHIINLREGQGADIVVIEHTLREYGFEEVDYVYEPGQFAVRGSILHVSCLSASTSSEMG